MKKYLITKAAKVNGKIRAAVVDGVPVSFPGFEDEEFFMHEPLLEDCRICNTVISDKITGAMLSHGWSYYEAYSKGLRLLNRQGCENLRLARMAKLSYLQNSETTDAASNTTNLAQGNIS